MPLSLYGDWGKVLKKVSELKHSLSAGFAGASAYTDGNGKFVLKMTSFFANKLKSNDTDMAIVRGVIAEHEGKKVDMITLVIETNDNKNVNSSSSIEDLFG